MLASIVMFVNNASGRSRRISDASWPSHTRTRSAHAKKHKKKAVATAAVTRIVLDILPSFSRSIPLFRSEKRDRSARWTTISFWLACIVHTSGRNKTPARALAFVARPLHGITLGQYPTTPLSILKWGVGWGGCRPCRRELARVRAAAVLVPCVVPPFLVAPSAAAQGCNV